MKKYTVKDTATGKNVTFSWEGKEPPTEVDLTGIFAEAKKQPVGNVGSDDWLPESRGGVPKWGLKNPKLWGARGAGLELYDKAVQPIVEAVGMAGGSLVSPVVGTALGYGTGKKAGEMGSGFLERAGMPEDLQRRQKTVKEELTQSAIDVAQPLVMGAGFKYTAKAIRPIDQKITQAIKYGMQKGIRPTVAGKNTYSQIQNYSKKSEQAVKTIVKNKSNLNLLDEFGEPVKNGLPTNLNQFSQAIEQSKRQIFDQYDQLAKLTGEKGVQVNATGVVKALREFLGNKSMKTISPETAEYAKKLMDRFSVNTAGISTKTVGSTQRGAVGQNFTAEEAQDMLKSLNESLKVFYKNPSYSSAKRAYVDQLVANNLRRSLDNTVLNTTGKHYQALKNEYGSLKSIEKEVSHRAVVDARKNPKGILDFSDVFTGYHAAKGILTMDPATMGAAGAGKAVSWLYRAKNQPNRMVKNMFKTVDRLMEKQGVTAQSLPPRQPKMDAPPKQPYRQRIPTNEQPMTYEQKNITHMGNVKQRVPTEIKSTKGFKVVTEKGTGANKVVWDDNKKY